MNFSDAIMCKRQNQVSKVQACQEGTEDLLGLIGAEAKCGEDIRQSIWRTRLITIQSVL